MTHFASEGIFVFSLDLELAWGELDTRAHIKRGALYQDTRQAIDRVLDLMERYEIRGTWATVGHLFLDRCDRSNGRAHPELVRPSYSWFPGDWLAEDPHGSVATDPHWYAPDILEKILRCATPQEIGCHSFSHVVAGDPGCSRECFDSEIKACLDVAREWGISLKSFVFPRNSVGHLDVLASNGFTNYRGHTERWYYRVPRVLGKIARRAAPFVTPDTLVKEPRYNDGLWNFPSSFFFPDVVSARGFRRLRQGIHLAMQRKSLFHLWLHPFNIANNPNALLERMEQVFREVASLREQGRIINPTMGELADVFSRRGQTAEGFRV